ncbi:GlxA family transcriptional regulator [Ramlibacter sp. Leaf400]|uniref:GlxA family transcriptional regulator n=1 Tax=Ramlibacter sp. Leaf400 TaxID=1736365 RepID=UPI0006F2D6B0|nr:DJ-1/PfpI family protein [Ramlibacter sp. Leaf400]KQT09519.1 AraC family transcriptional regulator [Ramlibacter sp. Leaf400]
MSRRVDVLIFPGFQLLDAAGPVAAFEAARGYELHVISAAGGPVRSSSGVSWLAEGIPRGDRDTLLVSGGEGVDAATLDEALVKLLRRASRKWGRVSSVCSGSLLLAAGGLLDGRTATTHWSRTAQFERQFPQVQLQPERIFVHDGPIWTSAGVTAGIDLALAIIGHDLGPDAARAVAQELVVYYRRPGGQSQFSALLSMQGDRNRFEALLDHVRKNLAQRHNVEDMAAQACMSPRHFARAFHEETGYTPAKAVERLRVEAARSALEIPGASVQRIAVECGFGDPERMRRSFIRLLGVPPSTLRRAAPRN